VEECDTGAANSDAPDAACRTDCRPARCGDGIVDPLRGEQCDDGNPTAGDGCAAACFVEPPPTAAFIAGGGSAASDCVVGWAMDRPARDDRGVPRVRQACRDGDPLCDFDPTPGVCEFHVWMCANVHEPRLPLCVPAAPALGTPVAVTVAKPSLGDASKRADDARNRQALLAAGAALRTDGLDACGPRLALRVALRTPTRAGSKGFRLRALTSRSAVDSDRLKLLCEP
jgi:cysteine-rich repeat protein